MGFPINFFLDYRLPSFEDAIFLDDVLYTTLFYQRSIQTTLVVGGESVFCRDKLLYIIFIELFSRSKKRTKASSIL
jgi:hypothetical protein